MITNFAYQVINYITDLSRFLMIANHICLVVNASFYFSAFNRSLDITGLKSCAILSERYS